MSHAAPNVNNAAGENTTLTLTTHAGSFPALPALGEALSKIAITIPAPHLAGERFIKAATVSA